jgi:general secretion pathway protein H
MSRAGSDTARRPGEAGFTLFELLAVMLILAMLITAVSTIYRAPSAGVQLRSAALLTASRLRDLRAAALTTGTARVATFDVTARAIRFSDGHAPLQLSRAIALSVTAARSERRRQGVGGVRFFPNGSSSGATIVLSSERTAYEVRVNWLTGRVSTAARN